MSWRSWKQARSPTGGCRAQSQKQRCWKSKVRSGGKKKIETIETEIDGAIRIWYYLFSPSLVNKTEHFCTSQTFSACLPLQTVVLWPNYPLMKLCSLIDRRKRRPHRAWPAPVHSPLFCDSGGTTKRLGDTQPVRTSDLASFFARHFTNKPVISQPYIARLRHQPAPT